MGLCDAEMTIPPAAESSSTISWTVGVGTMPMSTTSHPERTRADSRLCAIISPVGRESLPTTTLPPFT